jgi:cytochrome c oxidase subunit 3
MNSQETSIPAEDDNYSEAAAIIKSKKMLLYLGIFSIIMLFVGLTSAFIVSQSGGFWVDVELPYGFYLSTGVLLLCSATIHFAVKSVKANNTARAKQLVLLTLVFGLVFTAVQYFSWGQLIEKGNYVSSRISHLTGTYGEDYTFFYKGEALDMVDGDFYAPSDPEHSFPLGDKLRGSRNTASSYIYVLTFLHWLHLAGGLIFLFILINKLKKGKTSSENPLLAEQAATYWHFLDGLWIYLFLFLLFIH